MGYTKDGSITNFWPDDDEKTMYIADSVDPEELVTRIKDKWPGIHMTNFSISAENIHTHCIYYDRHDAGDYTQFIVVTRKD